MRRFDREGSRRERWIFCRAARSVRKARGRAFWTAFAEIYECQLALLELSKQDITAAGVSCGGPLSSEKGLILSPPNLPGWDSVPVCAYLGERLGVPVRLMNDADACAVAEWKFGAGAGKKT